MDLSAEPLYDRDANPADQRRGAQRAARSLAASAAKLHGAVALPIAAQQLLAATESQDFKVAEIVRIIESDPALAGRLIRQVSGVLAGKQRCSSIAQAVTLLGAKMLRASALAAAAMELFGHEEEAQARAVVEHASTAATIARFLASHCGLPADELYTAALLHDVGKLMLLRNGDAGYAELLAGADRADEIHVLEREAYGFDHALLAGHVLAAWKLPHPLPRVVAWHHQPARAFRASGQVPKMVALVRLADRLAHLPAAARVAEAVAAAHALPDELALLGFAPEIVPALCAGLCDELYPPAAQAALDLTPLVTTPARAAEDTPPIPSAPPTHDEDPAPAPLTLASGRSEEALSVAAAVAKLDALPKQSAPFVAAPRARHPIDTDPPGSARIPKRHSRLLPVMLPTALIVLAALLGRWSASLLPSTADFVTSVIGIAFLVAFFGILQLAWSRKRRSAARSAKLEPFSSKRREPIARLAPAGIAQRVHAIKRVAS